MDCVLKGAHGWTAAGRDLRLNKRFAVWVQDGKAVPALSNHFFVFSFLPPFTLTPGQWFKLIGLWATVAYAGAPGDLFNPQVAVVADPAGLGVQLYTVGSRSYLNPVSSNGAVITESETPLFAHDDYLQVVKHPFSLVQLQVTTDASSVVATNIEFTTGAVIEVYDSQLTTLS
jgi:hypothetical protein